MDLDLTIFSREINWWYQLQGIPVYYHVLLIAYLFAYQFYVSKTSQIEVLLFVSKSTQKPIVERNQSQSVVSYFGFQCDRFSDAINWEEFSLTKWS